MDKQTKVAYFAAQVVLCFASIAAWGFLSSYVVSLVKGYPMSYSFSHPVDVVPYLFFGCFFAPLWEELVFRKSIIDLSKTNDKFVVPFIVLSSALFGWLHGNGPTGVLVQGGMGLIFSWFYLNAKVLPYWTTVTSHALWNLMFLLIPR